MMDFSNIGDERIASIEVFNEVRDPDDQNVDMAVGIEHFGILAKRLEDLE